MKSKYLSFPFPFSEGKKYPHFIPLKLKFLLLFFLVDTVEILNKINLCFWYIRIWTGAKYSPGLLCNLLSHTAKQNWKITQFHLPTTSQKEAKLSGDTGCFRLKEGGRRALLSISCLQREPDPFPKPCRLPRGSQKTPLQCLGSHENVQACARSEVWCAEVAPWREERNNTSFFGEEGPIGLS